MRINSLPGDLADMFHKICYEKFSPEERTRVLRRYSEELLDMQKLMYDNRVVEDLDAQIEISRLYKEDPRLKGVQTW